MNKNVWIPAAIALALVMGLIAVTFGAQNDEEPVVTGNDDNDDDDNGGGMNNAGTIKVHDDATADPPMRNQPHVDCVFWIEGFNMEDDEGTIVFYAWPPTGDKTVVTPTGAGLTWTSDSTNSHGNFHFLSGPYSLPSGHYRVEVFNAAGHPGKGGEDDGDGDHDLNGEHFAKAKTFWVECVPEGETPPPPPQPVCPTVPTAIALTNGDVRLTWTSPADADSIVITRTQSGSDVVVKTHVLATTTTYLDTETEVGTTYTYTVNAVFDGRISSGCTQVEVTAIPEFPTVAGAALAGVAAIGAFVALRRR